MTRLLLSLACLLLSTTAFAQLQGREADPEAARIRLAETITPDGLRRHLSYLASDELEGRETGQPGQKKAAAYIADYFKSLGLPAIGENGGYYQTIYFSSEKWEEIDLEIGGKDLRHLWDYYSLPSQNVSRPATTINELVFLGYGIDDERYNDFSRAVDLKGKSILIFAGEPLDKKGNSRLSGTKDLSDWADDIEGKLAAAHRRGVETVFIIDHKFKENVAPVRKEILEGRLRMGDADGAEGRLANSVFITPDLARTLLGDEYKAVVKSRRKAEKSGKLKPVTVPVNIQLTQQKDVRRLVGENVMGFVEGSDPELKDEVLVISAHFDHIGMRGDEIFNGADDNGSGTSTLLELAEAYTLAKKQGMGPRRSILFLLVSGEEKGLLGSEYYANHPVFPLANTIADINVDMVGRVDEEHAGNPEYIYVIGSNRLSTDLHNINEAANTKYTKLELDYTYNAEDDPNRYYYRSDHYNFAERGIPSVFFFNGTHADYHRSTDTIEKINFEKMAKIGQLVFHTAWDLANRDERIRVDVK